MKPVIVWVVTFDGAEARVYAWDRGARRLTPIDLGLAAGAHRPEYADRPGRTFKSVGEARGSGDPRTEGERNLEDAFVKHLIEALSGQAQAHAFQKLVIAAPPRALGAFRRHAPDALTSRIQTEIGRNHVNTPTAALLDRLDEAVVP